ncbi:hypothetical protein H696_00905 [Fonticula alba]|uniref:Uncharacterized protein n=1 Tax=Fonticula alba TaxID=691883 RepID=A0A058ZHC6_FONAL|nr:hypothetical protein H696_00905 [Fonticula alba]KCV73366.1 hypothetical protein H696_00905 [Fonticula alba]|eukprot:XP_009493067.1 hypothetical protein H696_00905 [Fonticula alba]
MTTPQVFWTGDDQPGPGPGPTQLPQHVGLNAPRLEAANRLLATAGPVADGRPGPAQLAAARPPGHMPVGKVDASGITSNARHLLVPGDARHWCPAVYAALTARLINSVCS